MKNFRTESYILENSIDWTNGRIGVVAESVFYYEPDFNELKFDGLTNFDLEEQDCKHYRLINENESRIHTTRLD